MIKGFVKVAAATPIVRVADCLFNISQIKHMMGEAVSEGMQIIAFPELSITGYSCQDLFTQSRLIEEAKYALWALVKTTKKMDILTFVGMPLICDELLFNVCVVFHRGEILGIVPKTYLPNQREFQEKRWFASARQLRSRKVQIIDQVCKIGTNLLFHCDELKIGVEICEDLWMPHPPSSQLAMLGANMIINLSASNELVGKHAQRKQLVSQQSARCHVAYLYAAAGYGESSGDVVFAGGSMIAENGTFLGEGQRFATESQLIMTEIDLYALNHDRLSDTCFKEGLKKEDADDVCLIAFELPPANPKSKPCRTINPLPFVYMGEDMSEYYLDVLAIQTTGLCKRLQHTQSRTAVIGISGGLDSTLALLVTTMAFDILNIPRKQIIGVTMPGLGTTDRTYTNALKLMQEEKISIREISIRDAVMQHFKDIGHDPDRHNATYENAQARERTQILMDIANQEDGIVIGTGDLSELALGWATYNGDHMSMYNVNVGIPKTLVKALVKWYSLTISHTPEVFFKNLPKTQGITELIAEIYSDIVDTPISPELKPADANGEIAQKTEDLVGPYELHDFFLYHFLRYGAPPRRIYQMACVAFKEKYTKEVIKQWMYTFFRRFFQQQFKRSCLPDGPKVECIGLSPRGDWRMPSDASADLWLREVKDL